MARAEGENWLVGASTVTDARLHGVLNFNPMLGRIRLTDLAVYEKGKPQPILRFPLTKGDAWTFSLFDVETWEARVTSVRDQDVLGEATRIAYIEAEGSDGARLEYQFDSRAGWLRSLVYWTPDGEMSITMTLVSYGTGWEGRVYFVRGRDLYDGSYESTLATPIADVFDTFVDQGHPKYGDFTYLIYFTNYDISGDGEGAWILRDHTGTSQASSFYDPNTAGTELGTAPSVSGNWTLSLELTGNSYFRIRVAGGIEYSWKVEV
ncbi:MAG TPA: hypothetical protein EYP43_01105 [Thermoplasmata archaeon]|nr:hypothetical protein [Thermoplasmata archaeon]